MLCPFAGVDHSRHCEALDVVARDNGATVLVCVHPPEHDGDHAMGNPTDSGSATTPLAVHRCKACGCTDASPCLFHVAELETEIMCVWVLFGTKCTACVARERGELIGEVTRAPWNRDGEETGAVN